MAKRSATASIISKNMEPQDVEALESQFRRWVKSAVQLGMVQVLQDSNALAGEVMRAVNQWKPTDPPLPSLIYLLADLCQQLPAPPNTYFLPTFMADVINAHDRGGPIPPIPRQFYPVLRPLARRLFQPASAPLLPSTSHSAVSDGKRKESTPASDEEEVDEEDLDRKKCRVGVAIVQDGDDAVQNADDDVDSSNPDGADPGDDGEDEDEEDIDKMEVDQLPVIRIQKKTSSMRPPPAHKPTDPQPSTRPDGQPRITLKPKRHVVSAKYVSDSDDVAAESKPPARTQRPKLGLSEAELRSFQWEAYCKSIGLKCKLGNRPVLFENSCETCTDQNQLCWTLENMSACIFCREKKKRCSNSVKSGRTGTEGSAKGKEVKERVKQSSGKALEMKAKPIETTKTTAGQSAHPISTPQVPQRPAAIPGKDNTLASTVLEVPPPPAPLAPTPRRPTPLSPSQPSTILPPAPIRKARSRSRAPSRASTAGRSSHPSVEPAASVNTMEVDPLVALPAQPNEYRYAPPFVLPPSHLTSLPHAKEAGGAEVATRLEAAEEQIRQLAAETRRLNAQLQEQSNSSRRELHDIWQHLFKAENRDSQIERQVLQVTNRLGGVVSKVEMLERVSSVYTPSVPHTPILGGWQTYPNDFYPPQSGESQNPTMLVAALHYQHQQEEAMAIDTALKNMQPPATRGVEAASQEPPSAGMMQAADSGAVAPQATMLQPGLQPGGTDEHDGSTLAG